MSDHSTTWQFNWEVFVREIAARFASGDTERMLSEFYGNQVVTWEGTVLENKTNEKYAPGVAVNLPELWVPTKNDLVLVAGYVFLGIHQKSIQDWARVSKDEVVCFKCTLSSGNKIFPGVKISIFEEDKECVLKLTLENAQILSVE